MPVIMVGKRIVRDEVERKKPELQRLKEGPLLRQLKSKGSRSRSGTGWRTGQTARRHEGGDGLRGSEAVW